jgi:site-specific DNA-methyltransferase (cytosine-N4-specific)
MAEWGESFDVVIGDAPEEAVKSSIYATSLGAMYHGDSLQVLALPRVQKFKRKVQLVFTSPPFPLNTKKRYGNLKGEEYIEWFASFAPVLRDYLTKDGSIVVEIGNAWELGKPVMSTTVLKALLAFLEKGGLHLCQEFVWYNPARLWSRSRAGRSRLLAARVV